ncbi:MAG TPA: preprotein translocase subunit YajC [Gaiellaceae bacterium]|nr:preprotein translocase subunit YajC [Gaiellaceae bacterium]
MEPLIFIAVMAGLLWLVVIRPQRRRTTEHSAMISTLSVGDEIVTAGGVYGRITAIDEDVLTVEIAPGITVRVARGAITGVMNSEQKDNEAEPPIAPDDR